ncbi:class I SAM-dependent methyltransferase [Parapedobacter sp. DT-150]|uniref:class I SAM-dependent methyltransferase n=1 Tax=Parapedobacter sp. DT-150 TaxID=3396162 RepID=UPI003F1E21D8
MKRKSYQGVANIVRFNWHFYAMASAAVAVAWISADAFPDGIQQLVMIAAVLSIITVVTSLTASFYIYDLSNLYCMRWLESAGLNDDQPRILNIHAGFDETSGILKQKYGKLAVTICDFYNPEMHTEVSIRRARKAYPPHPKTVMVTTENLPFADGAFDLAVVMLAAHEIRDREERIRFFREVNRVITATGNATVTEHLRDVNNFLAFSIGFFHFYPRTSWLRTFRAAGLNVKHEIRSTPFIRTFILEKHDSAS